MGYPSKNLIYKLRCFDETKKSAQEDRIQSLFYAIKVRPQSYVGKAAIAIYIQDVTKKVHSKLLRVN